MLVVVVLVISSIVDVRVCVSRSTVVDVALTFSTRVDVDVTGTLTVSVTVEMEVRAGGVAVETLLTA